MARVKLAGAVKDLKGGAAKAATTILDESKAMASEAVSRLGDAIPKGEVALKEALLKGKESMSAFADRLSKLNCLSLTGHKVAG